MISPELADRLKAYYIGKLCSIITVPFSLPVDAKTYPQWFTIEINDIDQEAIIGTDVSRGTKLVFFFGPQLIGIAEEQVIASDHPDYEKIKQQMEERIKRDQDLIRSQSMPTKPEQIHSLQPLPILPQQCSAIEKISKQAADLKKKWTSLPTGDAKNE